MTPEEFADYQKAANLGESSAQYNLGILYATGDGVKQDSARAVYWYQKAAKQGNATAQDNLRDRNLTW